MIFLAIKHLMARKRQSLVTLLGIFIGTLAYIVISGFFTGFQNSMTDSLVSGDGHIKIQALERMIVKEEIEKQLFPDYQNFLWRRIPSGKRAAPAIENTQGWYDRLSASDEVVAFTPVYNTGASLASNGTTYNLSITGMRPRQQVKVTNIESKMVAGSLLDLEKGSGSIVIGKDLSDELAKVIGDVLLLTSAEGKLFPFKIQGIYSTGNKRSDLMNVYMTITDAQKVGNAFGKVSQISVKTTNFRKASDLAERWSSSSLDNVQSWDQLNSGFLSIFQTQDLLKSMITGVIMLVAAFGIYNILNMVVNQKRRDIAILRSMGYESKDVIRLFLTQGVALGIAGGLLGCLIGFFVCTALGTMKMGGPQAGTFSIPFDLGTYLQALLISNGVALLASYLPARAASKLTPIEIIRGGAE